MTPEQCRAVIDTLFMAPRHPNQMFAIGLMIVQWPTYPRALLFVQSDFNWLTLPTVRERREEWL